MYIYIYICVYMHYIYIYMFTIYIYIYIYSSFYFVSAIGVFYKQVRGRKVTTKMIGMKNVDFEGIRGSDGHHEIRGEKRRNFAP